MPLLRGARLSSRHALAMDSSTSHGSSEAWIRVPDTVDGPTPVPPSPRPPEPQPGPCPWRQADVEDFAHSITRGVARALRSVG